MADEKKKKVLVIDHETYQDIESGKKFTTHSRPTEPAPDGRFDSPKYAWHDVAARWVKLEDIDKPFLMEL